MNKFFFAYIIVSLCCATGTSQYSIEGIVHGDDQPLGFANVTIDNSPFSTITDSSGYYKIENITGNEISVKFSFLGFKTIYRSFEKITPGSNLTLNVEMESLPGVLDEVVVTGTMQEVIRSQSPIPVEVYQPSFFRKNPTPNLYEALQNVNGVRPQLNCNVCNTGDIHINGLEGPYTMVLIDGMPIVSSLASVYGLSGIPNSLIDRMEIIKGPASSLYGSEAIGGIINVITKSPENAPGFTMDLHTTSWLETNLDFGFKNRIGKKTSILTGINMFYFQNPKDINRDNFTDIAQQKRISIFQKWSFELEDGKKASLAGRYYSENRWGGELNWNESFRGGDDVYGESVYTNRWEIIGQCDLPWIDNLVFSTSVIGHDQNSAYGDLAYLANQNIVFGQLIYSRKAGNHRMLFGSALRYTYFDDNTPATSDVSMKNQPDKTTIPGLFFQDEIVLSPDFTVLMGLRNDLHQDHGNILTPRLALKWKLNDANIFRLNFGTGFRVVNLFTEDHAALTGARQVVITETLKPERSVNYNLNYLKKIYFDNGGALTLDLSAWHTKFDNLILPDYDIHPRKIIYSNIDGYAISEGLSFNANAILSSGLSFKAGFSLLSVMSYENNEKTRPYLSERFNGNWGVSYNWKRNKYKLDYTGNIYGPMLLPLASDLDPRNSESPYWSIQNIQLSVKVADAIEIYGGFKNLLDWTPAKSSSFLIAGSHDPFDKLIELDQNGNIVPTPENPYGLSFDPAYVYAPNQGRKLFFGIRYGL